ncbi:MAG: DEAD/DEAH box helicase [Butyrivibrio sp.]|nr:DEAD/DEAH box helicase [Butyrivibrio sp.]
MELDRRLIDGLDKIGIRELSAIQKECLEPALNGKNIIACAATGTGKTFAYLLPIISANAGSASLYSVILAPTKELCIQICSQINLLSNSSGIPVTAAALFGGVNKQRQQQVLKSKPNIVVGTYQRIYELIKERRISVHNVKSFVIDEADRLVNSENIDGIMLLRKCFMRDIQIMLFSASVTNAAQKTAALLSDNFVKIFTNEKLQIPSNIEHIYFTVERQDKIETVRKVIKALAAHNCIIFSNSKYDADEIAQKLEYHHYNAKCIHAGCDKNLRRQIVDSFRNGKTDYLICSDIAARGLDFKNVNAVINIGLPSKPTDYLHRAGRCGRGGQKAVCASIITENELRAVKACQKAFGINILPKKLYQGKIVRK